VFGLNADPAQTTGSNLLWKGVGKGGGAFNGLIGKGITIGHRLGFCAASGHRQADPDAGRFHG